MQQKKEFIEFIKLSHGHHTKEYCMNELGINEKCSIYDAIQKKVKDSTLIQIALEEDDEIKDSFENFKLFQTKGE